MPAFGRSPRLIKRVTSRIASRLVLTRPLMLPHGWSERSSSSLMSRLRLVLRGGLAENSVVLTLSTAELTACMMWNRSMTILA